jgi:hypothetical protein
MRNGFLALTVLIAGGSLALAEEPTLSAPKKFQAVTVVDTSAQAASPAPPGAMAPDAALSGGYGEACGQGGQTCGPPGRFWISAEYLLWWFKNDHLPPLVTLGTPESFGILGAPGTTVDFGGGAIEHPVHHGGRFTVGAWLNDCQTKGIEADYFFLGRNTENFTTGSTGALGTPVIARPFFDVLSGTPSAEIVAFPGVATGNIDVAHRQSLQGAEVNAICNLCCCGECDDCGGYHGRRIDLLAGFRWLELHEDVTIRENVTIINPDLVDIFGFTNANVVDRFETRNNFYGGQIGVRGEWWRGRLFVNARGTVALGDTNQHVRISGSTVLTLPDGTVVTLPGGLLALPTNIGNYHRNEFSVVPEFRINLGYQFTEHMRAFIGYTFLYWTQVARPGEQINLNVNSTQIPTSLEFGPLAGPAQPSFSFRQSDFWAQGLNLGVEFRF